MFVFYICSFKLVNIFFCKSFLGISLFCVFCFFGKYVVGCGLLLDILFSIINVINKSFKMVR